MQAITGHAASVLAAPGLRVGVLEDDEQLRECILLPGLADYGFQAIGFASASALYRTMLSERLDIVVLDIGLPDEDGITVARHLRAISPLGIVMLTGNRARDERIQALNGGADAFLSKPVDVEVLVATLHSVARRLVPVAEAPYSAAAQTVPRHWRRDADGWCLLSPAGASIALTVPERCVMECLFKAAGETVGREALIAALAADVYDFDPHRLEMLVYRLRRKVHEHTGESLPLLTVRGAGYLFVAEQAR